MILASRTCFSDKTGKIQQEKNTRHTDKGKYSGIRFRQKVKYPPSPPGVELLALLSRSRLSLLSANRQSCKLLARDGLYFWSCCFVAVVYPDAWLKQNNGTLQVQTCTDVQKTILTGLEEENMFSSPLTESQLAILRVHLTLYRSRATVAAFRVPPTPYRPRVTVAAMDKVVAVAQAVKGQVPFWVTRRQLSFQAWIRREYRAISDWSACCRKVMKQGCYESVCIHFGYCIDTVEAGLSLPGLLLLEHPQTTHLP